MNTDERKATRKTYEQPELKVMTLELGVYGNYGDAGGFDLQRDISRGFGGPEG